MGCYRLGSGTLGLWIKPKICKQVKIMGSRRARKHQRVSNPALAKAMRELRRSSSASRHVLKKYKGSRAAHIRRAVRDSKDQ